MTNENAIWLEGVKENFELGIATGDYMLCREMIEVLKEEGFEVEAKTLQAELVEETLGTFIHETDPRLWN